MDIFKIHSQIMKEYRSYIESFINISDLDIREKIKQEIENGKLWSEPLIQFNPSFEINSDVKTLIKQGLLAPELDDIFEGYKLYSHQLEAIKLGNSGNDFIVTSGTGSGKSLTYLGTIFNDLFKNKSYGQGIKAIIVYPMNALINSQTEEINKYKTKYEIAGKVFPIKFAQYTGQEEENKRIRIREELPDIILTNYMMLELILTRLKERTIRDSIYESLKYLVFDELHTYRGRQGADVGILIRRIKANCRNKIIGIGTSATMVSGGSIKEQKEKIADVASILFGTDRTKFSSDQIINEKLTRSFSDKQISKNDLFNAIKNGIKDSKTFRDLKECPVAIWLECNIALTEKEGVLIRNKPQSFSSIIKKLSEASGDTVENCTVYLQKLICWVGEINRKLPHGHPHILPFKLHQFISQTGSVYTTLDKGKEREITLEPAPFKAEGGKKKPLFPNVFSRTSGAPFICAAKNTDKLMLIPRDFRESSDTENGKDGYLITDLDAWNPDTDLEKLPDSWLQFDRDGNVKGIAKDYRELMPTRIYYNQEGNYSETHAMEFEAWFMPQPLLFDPTSGTTWDTRTSEATKLSRLGSEGRSTSTTITTFSILKALADHGFNCKDQKLLSFTDNRQDAALQAGHFNDYMDVIKIRAAIYKALCSSQNQQLNYKNIGQAVFDSLGLDILEYADIDTVPLFPTVRKSYEEALKKYLVYRILYDLRRSWRVVLPNLEQCALLNINYDSLTENASIEEVWTHIPLINELSHTQRTEFLYQILEYFRQSYAIYSANYLSYKVIDENYKEINEKLKNQWKFETREDIPDPFFLRYSSIQKNNRIHTASLGPNSLLGRYIKSFAKEINPALELKKDNYNEFMKSLLDTLEHADYLKSIAVKDSAGDDIKIYQLRIDKIIWILGDKKTVRPDIFLSRAYKEVNRKPHLYFQEIYQIDYSKLKNLEGQDHTGQLNNTDRIEREDKFRQGELSVLFCSPTMELGIDISNLSVVHMRNAPPNPSSYAQRSGRAGRSGQGALVFTYCSSYSSHDRHYFKNQVDLVAGEVAPPNIDLVNEELLRTHLNALLLSEVGVSELDYSIINLLEETDYKNLPLRAEIQEKLKLSQTKFDKIKTTFKVVISDIILQLKNTYWYSDQWIEYNLNNPLENLNRAINRWRTLYFSARAQLSRATQKLESGVLINGSNEYKQEKRNLDQAQRQIDLLRCQARGTREFSEFYPYRYLASEAFLPGYNFTRLPLRTFIEIGDGGEFISRPRTIAIREFGPLNSIYHKGAKYQVKQLISQNYEEQLERAKVCISSGFFLSGEKFSLDSCPFSGVSLEENNSKKVLTNLLPMSETLCRQISKISCEEEERISRGYDIEIYFSIDDTDRVTRTVIKADKNKLINLSYIPASRLIYLNRKWKSKNDDGFLLGMTNGFWKKPSDLEKQIEKNDPEEIKKVFLYITDTADALYLEPVKPLGLSREGIITLQYALKKAIEKHFNVESSEISVISMGGADVPNIFLYESAEGSLGILSQFVQSPTLFNIIIEKAIEACRFDLPVEIPASYDDLLNYYNQRDHAILDKWVIKDSLNKLKACQVEIIGKSGFKSYEEHYQSLLKQMDINSCTEKKFLDYLYQNDFRLPDAAQKMVNGLYIMSDFFYEPDVWIFCDGTPHDKPSVKEDDKQKRQALINRGNEVIVYYYQDDLDLLVKKRPDIFKKVR